MSITTYNGSALCAMVGKNCFTIASDWRLGVQFQTIATDYERIFKIHDKLYIGLSGLGTDVQTLKMSSDFVVSGTASKSLYGACESMYKPDLEPDDTILDTLKLLFAGPSELVLVYLCTALWDVEGRLCVFLLSSLPSILHLGSATIFMYV